MPRPLSQAFCFVLLVALPLLCVALQGEESFSTLVKKWRAHGQGGEGGERVRVRRTPGQVCPSHPKPLPQELINHRVIVPDVIKKALNQLEQWIGMNVQQRDIGALSIGVVYDQQLVWNRNFGQVNPNDPTSKVTGDTPFRVGSITKALTTLMLLKVRDEGKVEIDSPVSKYVPQFKVKSPYRNTAGITWRSLASQNSGLQGSVPCDYFSILEPFLDNACAISNDEAWRRLSLEEVMAPMYNKPHYADSAYAIIGRGLEYVLEGSTYEDYMTNKILQPLGMKNTFFSYRPRANQIPPGRNGNTTMPSFVSFVDLNWARPTGQLYSTVNDLQKFMSLYFLGDDDPPNNINILSSTLREMLQPVSVNDDGTSAYGLPWEILFSSVANITSPYWIVSKTGAMIGFSGTILMIPEMKLGLILLMNDMAALDWAISAFSMVQPAFEEAFAQYAEEPPSPSNITKFAGTYVASALLGVVTANMTVKVAESASGTKFLQMEFAFGSAGAMGTMNATWVGGNNFQVVLEDTYNCLGMQSGWNNVFVYFQINSWTGEVYSLTAPGVDPLYGWTFYKQGGGLFGRSEKDQADKSTYQKYSDRL